MEEDSDISNYSDNDEEQEEHQARESNEFTCDIQAKLELAKRILEINKHRSYTFKKAVKKIDWKEIKIPGYNEEDLKAMLDSMLKMINSHRLFDEVLDDYTANYSKYELKKSKQKIHKPCNNMFKYVMKNYSAIKEDLKLNNSDAELDRKQVWKLAAEKFENLPIDEQKRNKKKYQDELERYLSESKEFKNLHSELHTKPTLQENLKNSQYNKVTKIEPKHLNPSWMVYQEYQEKCKDFKLIDAKKIYACMENEEKLKYINKLVNLETPLKKVFSYNDKVLMRGPPQRAPSEKLLFKASLKKDAKGREIIESCNGNIMLIWQKANVREKNRFKKEANAGWLKWAEEVKKWIMLQPAEKHAALMKEYKLNDEDVQKRLKRKYYAKAGHRKGRRTGKRLSDEEDNVDETDDDIDEEIEGEEQPPSKKMKNSSESIESTMTASNHSFGTRLQRRLRTMSTFVASDSETITELSAAQTTDTAAMSNALDVTNQQAYSTYEQSFFNNASSSSPITVQSSENNSILAVKTENVKTDVDNEGVMVMECDNSPKSGDSNEDKTEEILASLGAFPSLTCAHYFMTTKCTSKVTTERVAKLYKKLPKHSKKKLYQEMSEKKNEFIENIKANVHTLNKWKVIEFHKQNQAAQTKAISWHTPNETDYESDSSDSELDN